MNKDCQCSSACEKFINEEEQKQNFYKFWNLADFNKQNLFLHATTRNWPRRESAQEISKERQRILFLNII